jgi:DNA-binding beta-propeller fold protein YncE
MGRSPLRLGFLLIPLALACFAFSPTAFEVTRAGNAGYPNQNTAEDDDALFSLDTSQGLVKQSFPVGNDPFFLVFDGANIWVTNAGDNTVTKLRASDGANLGTFPVGGLWPAFITFDGAQYLGVQQLKRQCHQAARQ